MTRSKTAKLAKLGKPLPPITLEDIKKIKLKSTATTCAKVSLVQYCSGIVPPVVENFISVLEGKC